MNYIKYDLKKEDMGANHAESEQSNLEESLKKKLIELDTYNLEGKHDTRSVGCVNPNLFNLAVALYAVDIDHPERELSAGVHVYRLYKTKNRSIVFRTVTMRAVDGTLSTVGAQLFKFSAPVEDYADISVTM